MSQVTRAIDARLGPIERRLEALEGGQNILANRRPGRGRILEARIEYLEKKVKALYDEQLEQLERDAREFYPHAQTGTYVQVVYDEQHAEGAYVKLYTYRVPPSFGDPKVGDRVGVYAAGRRIPATIVKVTGSTPAYSGIVLDIDYYL